MTDPIREITGEIVARLDGVDYRLVLGMRGLGMLQAEFGVDLAPFIVEQGKMVDFGAVLRVVEVALTRHHPDAADDVAERLLAQDLGLWSDLLVAAFPSGETGAKSGKGKAAQARRR